MNIDGQTGIAAMHHIKWRVMRGTMHCGIICQNINGSHSCQRTWSVSAHLRTDCLSVAFNLSTSPLDCGRYAAIMLYLTFSSLNKAPTTAFTYSGPLSLVILTGHPCRQNTSVNNHCVIVSAFATLTAFNSAYRVVASIQTYVYWCFYFDVGRLIVSMNICC